MIGWVRGNYAKTEEELQKSNDLYEKNMRLEKELSELKSIIGKDTSELAQGGDQIDLDFSVKEFKQQKNFTWDELFVVIAKRCLKGDFQNSEKNIIYAVADYIGKAIGLTNLAVISQDKSFLNNFEKIKIQFVSLDYIDITMQSYSVENKIASLWNLTVKGKRHFSDIMAIRRKTL